MEVGIIDLDAIEKRARDIVDNNEFLTTYAHATELADEQIVLIARIRELENHRDQAVDVATRLDEKLGRYKDALEKIASATKDDLKPSTGQWAAGCAWLQSIAEGALRE